MARVKIYSTGTCSFCLKTKALLQKWNIPYEEIRIDTDTAARGEFARVTDRKSVV